MTDSIFLPIPLGYLLGSIPFGLILTRLVGAGDIRQTGSGNIGATNVLRTGRKNLAALTLLLDSLKGAAAVFLAAYLLWNFHDEVIYKMARENTLPLSQVLSHPITQATGFAALLGHVFPVWLRFKGGKGVATSLGVVIALNVWMGILLALTWLAVAFIFRISSLAALTAALLLPVYAALLAPHLIWLSLAMAALVIWTHKTNIQRLRAGTEPKIGKK